VGSLEYIVRKPDWNDVDEKGVPHNSRAIMNYFNDALRNQAYPYVPRHEFITEEEILNRWVPSKDDHITYVVRLIPENKVVNSGTLFLNPEKTIGELNVTGDPNYFNQGIGTTLVKTIVEDALANNITVYLHTSIENIPMQKVMEKCGYTPNRTMRNYPKYIGKVEGSGHVYEYVIKPEATE